MTLSRQLILSGLFILLCLFGGMLTFMVRNTQQFLNQQLASHSQDSATALGLTLTTTMKINDVVTIERTVDAMWDRGYYKSIVVESADGGKIVERQAQIKVHEVPQWFINLLKLKTVPKEAIILDGWTRVGKVRIESNPGFAYKQIWTTFVESGWWFLVTAIIAAILGSLLLYVILRPLRAITEQATAICNQQFAVQEKLPWTFDLRLVVEAMNNMSMRLKKYYEEQSRASEELREEAYKDPVTDLGNRRYFDMQFDHLLSDKERGFGGFLLIELQDFKEYNDKHGYEEGDRLLQNTARVLEESCRPYSNAILARLKGANMAAVLPNITKEAVKEIAERISREFAGLFNKNLSKEPFVGACGAVLFSESEEKTDVLAKADMALRKAQTLGSNRWHFLEEVKEKEIHGEKEWAIIFDRVIRENKVLLHFQETQLWVKGQPKTYETLMRLKLNDKDLIVAGVFMPMAERLRLMISLDKLMIENVVSRILKGKHDFRISVNISPSSLEDEEFLKWLLGKLKQLGKKSQQLMIELPEYGVISRIDVVREFFLEFAALGGKTAIDHYGKNFSSFSYLYNLKLNFLKIDGGFIKNIHENEENQFFVRSLVDIAHSLDIFVIAESVETKAEFNMLKELRVDGVQGYYIGKPMEIEI